MTINLTISAESAKDFFTHLAEVAAGFAFTPAAPHPVMPEVAASVTASIAVEAVEDKPKRTRRTNAQIAADNAAAAQEAAAEQVQGEETEPASEATSGAGEKSEGSTAGTDTSGSTTSTSSTATSSASPSDTRDIDYDRDVVPLVLLKVREKGKPWVAGVLETFGVAKAGELDPALFGELVDALNGE